MVDGASVGSVVVENLHGGGSATVMVTVSYRKSYGKSVPYGQKSWCVRSVVAVTNFVGRNYARRSGKSVVGAFFGASRRIPYCSENSFKLDPKVG